MQFMMSVIDSTTGSATGTESAAIDQFNDWLRANGHWVLAAGLAAPAASTVLDNRNDAGQVTEGPFAETAEYVAGLWIIEASGHDTALTIAAAASKACHRKVELRPFL